MDVDELPSISLTVPQYDELFDDEHYLLIVCGGRGSGKTEIDGHHIVRRGSIATDQVFALGANNYDQLQNAIVPRVTSLLDSIGEEYVFENRVPRKWRREWKRNNIIVPQIRLRNIKMLITRSGIHIWLFTLSNNSWRKLKSLEVHFLLAEEAWEPQVPLREFLTYAVGSVRCGLGKKPSPDVESECKRRGHMHGIVIKGNVPLNQPDNPIYSVVQEFEAKEEKRRKEGKGPYFKLIKSRTQDNPHLPEDFLENMRGALDEDTFIQQTSGDLTRNQRETSYYTFSEQNVHDGLVYDPRRPIYFWFDFNPIPAVAGFGQDLQLNEVPKAMKALPAAANAPFFGIIGELFNDQERMGTEQVAAALLENPQRSLTGYVDGEERCIDCPHTMVNHIDTKTGVYVCRRCANKCAGVAATVEDGVAKYLHVPPNWQGLINHKADIYIYADASGRNDTPAAANKGGSIAILKDAFLANLDPSRVHFRIKAANPPVSHRVLSVVRMLKTANDVRALYVHPRCVGHIDDFREVVPDPKTGQPKKVTVSLKDRQRTTYWKRTHATDGFGYMSDWRWPYRMPKGGALPTVATPEMAPDGLEETDGWPTPG